MARRRSKRRRSKGGGLGLKFDERVITVVLGLIAFLGIVSQFGEELITLFTRAFIIAAFAGVAYVLYRVYRRRARKYPVWHKPKMPGSAQSRHEDEHEALEKRVVRVFTKQGYRPKSIVYTAGFGINYELHKGGSEYALIVKKDNPNNPVFEQEIRSFFELMIQYEYEYGMFVTSGRFSETAVHWAQQHQITLVNGAELLEMEEKLGPDTTVERMVTFFKSFIP